MRIKQEHKVIILASLAGAFLWLMDAFLDKFDKYPDEPFLKVLLLDTPSHEFWLRPIFVLSFTIFGLLIAFYMKKGRFSEGRYHHLFDSINDIVLVKPFTQQFEKERLLEANPVASLKLGYAKEELLQLALANLIDPKKVAEFPAITEKLQNRGHFLFETALMTKAGNMIPTEVSSHVVDFNGNTSVLSIARDITERKKSEAEHQKAEECLRDSECQLRILTARLLEVQEAERSRIAKEMHDELGQSLMLLKLQLSSVMDHLRKDQRNLRQECSHMLNDMDALIENIRRLITDLSPTVLEELGLTSAIKLLLEEFVKHYSIEAEVVNFDDIDQLFPPPVRLGIYRIFQESLTNIGKHAKATQVSATINKMGHQVSFLIKDNGQGFNLEGILGEENRTKGTGLSTMIERARLAGGKLEINSRVGAGTEIAFMIPARVEREAENGHL
jgi:PAS domain S-box-containing protein